MRKNNIKDIITYRLIFLKGVECEGCRYRNIMVNLVLFVFGLGKFLFRKESYFFGEFYVNIK